MCRYKILKINIPRPDSPATIRVKVPPFFETILCLEWVNKSVYTCKSNDDKKDDKKKGAEEGKWWFVIQG